MNDVQRIFQLFAGHLKEKETINRADFQKRISGSKMIEKVRLWIYGLRYNKVGKDEYGNVFIA